MTLTFAPAAWSAELARLLEAAMRRDPCCTIKTLEHLVDSGAATLIRISRETGELFGAVVLEIDRHDRGADGVIVAAAMARRANWRYVPAMLADLERRFQGLARIRVQTPSRGLAKMLARAGYGRPQVTLYKELAPRAAPAPAIAARRLSAAEAAALELPDLELAAFAGGIPAPLRLSHGPAYIKGHQTAKTYQQDRRLALSEGAIGISGDSNVLNVLDAGAIEGAFDFAKASDQETHKTLAGVLDFADTVFKTGASQVEQAYSEARGEATQKNLVAAAALATVAVVAIKVWGKA